VEFLSLHDGDVLLVGGEIRLSVTVLNGTASIAVSNVEQAQPEAKGNTPSAELVTRPCFIMLSPKEPPP
jgi:hypothetical protein